MNSKVKSFSSAILQAHYAELQEVPILATSRRGCRGLRVGQCAHYNEIANKGLTQKGTKWK
jgi:hypothetical protein